MSLDAQDALHEEIRRRLERALEAAQRAGDPTAQAAAWLDLANHHKAMDHMRDCYEQAADLYHQLGDTRLYVFHRIRRLYPPQQPNLGLLYPQSMA